MCNKIIRLVTNFRVCWIYSGNKTQIVKFQIKRVGSALFYILRCACVHFDYCTYLSLS